MLGGLAWFCGLLTWCVWGWLISCGVAGGGGFECVGACLSACVVGEGCPVGGGAAATCGEAVELAEGVVFGGEDGVLGHAEE